ncbi:Ribosome-binding factor A [Thermodesulfobium narugense DSM 14796]|uniref:Ribosome-binding factor A n=1 Tax=Thermodesulfobium narugense DSM 14796 TaxID=747365 RepID=M1E5G0_9BACT|nr:30S ribosome-binding factor RbfA [Thermodesulfobium narugense]AEE14246.1 Ribosome-binding factor A [Thermodesulfobium narugense DSM 14796]
MSVKAERLKETIRKELAVLLYELKDVRIKSMVSIMELDMSSDHKNIKVWVSIYGDEKSKEETMKGLVSASRFLRGELARRIGLKYAPQILFAIDNSLERGDKIFEILKKIEH